LWLRLPSQAKPLGNFARNPTAMNLSNFGR